MFKRLKQLSKSFYLTFIRPRRVYHFTLRYRDNVWRNMENGKRCRPVITETIRVHARTRKAALRCVAFHCERRGIRHGKYDLTHVTLLEAGQSMQSAY
ncbi:zinc finger protein 2-like protein [Vibrio phage vB_VpP_DE18]|uniref:Zinc finger protein 2-like protein n=1 Tax=Vibrio phage vB_VpP_DE18 TaxID=2836122 RepID=A0A8F3C8B0_9CAUD|nr:zinc finger protein 2-like protein [Vibrio phage vB_VpP_DE18]